MCFHKNVPIKSSIVFILLIMINGCVESTEPNHNPIVNSIVAFPNPVQVSDSFAVFCSADDVDGDPLSYDWFCTNGGATIKGASPDSQYQLINTKENLMIFYSVDSLIYGSGHATIFCDVRDGKGGLKTVWIIVPVTEGSIVEL